MEIVLGGFMVYAMVVVIVGMTMLLAPVPAGPSGLPPLDRRVFCITAVLISALVIGLLFAAYCTNPAGFKWAVARPLDRILSRYYWVMFAGAALYVIVRLCGAKARRSLWLLCLSLPGALTFPVAFVAALASGAGTWEEIVFEFLIHPATWILPFVALRQWSWLQTPRDTRAVSALALTVLIIGCYILAAPVL